MTITSKTEFYTLLKGATFLASGGGGPYALAKSLVDGYFKDTDVFAIDILNLDTVSLEKWTTIAGGMAQPSAAVDLTPEAIIEPTVNAVKAMEKLIINDISKNDDSRFDDLKSLTCYVLVRLEL